ncbi:hypothetical protein GCM10028820_08040 [Tessaracoccus terricola]
MDLLMPILFTVVFVGAMVFGIIHHNRRKKLWNNWARARNWAFVEKWPQMVGAFRGGPFNRGSSRKAFFGYHGRFDGLPVQGFEYQYTTGSGKNRTTHSFHVDVLQLNGRFPRFSISRENWATRTFGSDLKFENAQFNREWNVRSDSARFAHDVIHPRMMGWLMSGEVPQYADCWFENGCLLVSTSGSRRPEHVDAYLRFLTKFASQLPRFLLEEVGLQRLPLTWDGPGVTAQEQAAMMARLTAEK